VEQIQLISRYAKTIVLVYDADSAGSKATMRGVDLVIETASMSRLLLSPGMIRLVRGKKEGGSSRR